MQIDPPIRRAEGSLDFTPTMNMEKHIEQLKTLYPNLSAEELVAVKDTLDRYLLLAWEIYEELERNPQASLTPSSPSSSIHIKVDSPTN